MVKLILIQQYDEAWTNRITHAHNEAAQCMQVDIQGNGGDRSGALSTGDIRWCRETNQSSAENTR